MNATRMMTLLAAGSLAIAAQGLTLSVKDVKIAQRYPWNGLVDIDYTVECDDPDADVYVYPTGYDKDYNTTMPLWTQYLTGDGATNAVKAGTHRMTWNMAAQMGAGYNRAEFAVKMNAYAGAAPYMVIDLAAGPNAEKYTISYLNAMPGDTWPDEYKTTKLVLRLIPAGTYIMGGDVSEPSGYNVSGSYPIGLYSPKHSVTLTQPFYMAIFKLSQQQYASIMSGTPSSPKEYQQLSYNALRGSTLGAGWPSHQQVDATSLIGKLRARTGITFDLPTEAQWEYAARELGVSSYTTGTYNSLGLCDMYSSYPVWCRDWLNTLSSDAATDPKGASSGYYSTRVVKGGYYTGSGSNGLYVYASSGSGYSWRYLYLRSPYTRFYRSYGDRSDYNYTPSYSSRVCCRLVALPGDGTN